MGHSCLRFLDPWALFPGSRDRNIEDLKMRKVEMGAHTNGAKAVEILRGEREKEKKISEGTVRFNPLILDRASADNSSLVLTSSRNIQIFNSGNGVT